MALPHGTTCHIGQWSSSPIVRFPPTSCLDGVSKLQHRENEHRAQRTAWVKEIELGTHRGQYDLNLLGVMEWRELKRGNSGGIQRVPTIWNAVYEEEGTVADDPQFGQWVEALVIMPLPEIVKKGKKGESRGCGRIWEGWVYQVITFRKAKQVETARWEETVCKWTSKVKFELGVCILQLSAWRYLLRLLCARSGHLPRRTCYRGRA